MNKDVLVVLLLIQILNTLCDPFVISEQRQDFKWDVLVFTQRWPTTACIEWQAKKSNNTCAFPNPSDLWTIHGIWPTKSGTKGPENCNSTWHFNETIIIPIRDKLKEYWTNVENNTVANSLWKHEWVKHGTCGASLPQLNNELKYFSAGLEWIQKYNMKDILLHKQVIPNEKGYMVQFIFDSIKTVLKYNPIIQCISRHHQDSLISEIQICFDTKLSLIDCDSVIHLYSDVIQYNNLLTNCNIKKAVLYPNSTIPITTTTVTTPTTPTPTTTKKIVDNTSDLLKARNHLITFYRTIKLLMWATI